MGMGIVDDKEFQSALQDCNKPASTVPTSTPVTPEGAKILDINRGRGEGNVEVPDSLRKVIGETSVSAGRAEALALANNFGISPSAVSAYSKGATSTSSYNDRPNESHIIDSKVRVQNRARGKLMKALSSLTDDKIAAAKAREISGIAKDMSVIIKNMEEDKPTTPGTGGPTFVFYAPQKREESDFPVITVKE